ncbi:MAG: oligosaccharide flippase family protein, partial [Methanobacterium sp.]
FFVLGKRVVGMPLSVIEGAVAQVFYPQASEAYRDGNLKAVILNTFSSLFSIILVPILLLMIAGPDLIAVVFGEAWRMAGVFLVWLAPRILAQFISSPLSLVFVVQQRQDLNLKIDALLFVCNIGTVISGGLLKNSLLAIQLLGVGTFVCYSFACYKIFRLAEVHFSEVFQVLFSVARKAIPYILMPLLVFLFYHHAGIMVFVSVLSGCLFLLLQSREWGSIYRQ